MSEEDIAHLIRYHEIAAKACRDDGEFDDAAAYQEAAELWRQRLEDLRACDAKDSPSHKS
jgi:hypothetical protein